MCYASILVLNLLIIFTVGSRIERVSDDEPRIHFGDEPWEPYPSLVSLGYVEPNGRAGVFCGGSLITDQHILTAAHCYSTKYSTFRAVLGSRYKYGPLDAGGEVIDFGLNAWTVNPGYNASNFHTHDTAVITLPRRVRLSSSIQTIPLARYVYSDNVRVVGWGRMDCQGNSPDYYLYAGGWIVDDNSCRRAWYDATGGSIPIYNDQLCAQFRNRRGFLSGSDGGDSGGPLYATAYGRDVQIGTVSFSTKLNVNTTNQCTNAQVPMVYNKMAAEERFIRWVAPNAQFF
ncbi:unnamed protein product [Allacma fusca]|uniref:Peptidase S1 domain-containing protein n=1 Tax=Allacma fusca TaxID=39272 RepID=A0A8J2PCP8_9HEXA|nr:unnamed protein product [Allacma fusca]